MWQADISNQSQMHLVAGCTECVDYADHADRADHADHDSPADHAIMFIISSIDNKCPHLL